MVTSERVDELDAEHWIARWEREAEKIGRREARKGYWDEAWRWISGERGGEAARRGVGE